MNRNEKTIRKEWFDKHKVLSHNLSNYKRNGLPIETLIWGTGKSIHMKIWYILMQTHGVLMVYGDLGEAIYRWYGSTTLEWISKLDLSYFHSKTCASEFGRVHLNYEWDPDKAKKQIFEHFKQTHDCKGYKKFKDSDFKYHMFNKNEFIARLNESGTEEIFGSDWWEWVSESGDTIPARCRAHLIGLKIAFKS